MLDGPHVIIAVPMNNPRTDATIWAELYLSTWLNVIECGADAAWFFAFKTKDRGHGQVRMSVPRSSRDKTTNATIARIIANAKVGQQARILDRNPLNLRSENVYLIGDPRTPDGMASHAKTETRAHVRGKAALRATLRKGGEPECLSPPTAPRGRSWRMGAGRLSAPGAAHPSRPAAGIRGIARSLVPRSQPATPAVAPGQWRTPGAPKPTMIGPRGCALTFFACHPHGNAGCFFRSWRQHQAAMPPFATSFSTRPFWGRLGDQQSESCIPTRNAAAPRTSPRS